MSNVLYLVHRLPYPPTKGDKVRSYHLLRHLASRHRVFLATFLDDPADEAHVEAVRALCAELHVARLHPLLAKLRSLTAFATGAPLTVHYYRDKGLMRWVRRVGEKERIDCAVVFSSSMAQFTMGLEVPMVMDFVDVDSAKWTDYGSSHSGFLARLYEREGRALLACERAIAASAQRCFFVTEKEAALFRRLAPEHSNKVDVMGNGVDAEFFCPDPSRASPFERNEVPLVFTGAMDYWPNIDAVVWFVREVWPRLRSSGKRLRLHLVGRNPSAQVRSLVADDIHVTGTVPDVRPYLQHALAVLAPLRIARGVQNKILEAMSMARPVIASHASAAGIEAQPGTELLTASDAGEFADRILDVLQKPDHGASMGSLARARVVENYDWGSRLGVLDRFLVDRELAA